jgi:hypothetical protein
MPGLDTVENENRILQCPEDFFNILFVHYNGAGPRGNRPLNCGPEEGAEWVTTLQVRGNVTWSVLKAD